MIMDFRINILLASALKLKDLIDEKGILKTVKFDADNECILYTDRYRQNEVYVKISDNFPTLIVYARIGSIKYNFHISLRELQSVANTDAVLTEYFSNLISNVLDL